MEELRNREAQAEKIIKKYTLGSTGVGLIPLPLVDLAGITALQVKLVHSLAVLYEIEFSEHRVKALVAALIGGGHSVLMSPKLASLLKFFPLGSSFAFFATSGLGAVTTYAIGKVFILHFESGGTLLNFDPQSMRDYYIEYLDKDKPADILKSFVGVKP
jgi:uncharacterized protein (DUF697 family)